MKAFLGCARAWLGLLALGLASCGGGTQIEPFQPRQIILLGDETAVLAADGRHYSMNELNTNGAVDCNLLPTWTQQLVANFNLALDRCSAGGNAGPAVTRGAPGAKASDLPAQVDAQLAAGPVTSKDLFVVMVGLNDVIECYETPANCAAGNTLADRGSLVAQQVNRIIAAGGRVIVSTVHDVGLTPYARAKDAVNSGQAAVLTQMTFQFNSRVRVDILQDGRFVGLVLADDTTQAMVKAPGAFNLANVTDAACTVALPDCTTSTLVSGATSATHLWADDRHFGPVMHNQLALSAEARAHNNPF